MLSSNRSIVFGLVILFVLSACGGGGGSDDTNSNDIVPLAIAAFNKTYAPDVSTGGPIGPFNTQRFSRFMDLYRATDISGSGYIESISFRFDSPPTMDVTCPEMTIRLGHSVKTELSNTTFANQFEDGAGSLITVVDNATVAITAGAVGDYYNIPLETPFYYNGVNSLIVDVEQIRTGGGIFGCNTNVSNTIETSLGYDAQLFHANQVSLPAIGALLQSKQHIKFNFAGGENELDYAVPLPSNAPFGTPLWRFQNVHLASDIDGSGPITGIALKTAGTTTGAIYDYSLRLGHTNLAALGSIYDNNYSGPAVTVANQTNFTIPADIPTGEWVWIPIPDGVFNYNGVDNLIVDISVLSATANTFFSYANLTNDRGVLSSDNTALVGNLIPSVSFVALRFNGGPVSVITDGAGFNGSTFSTGEETSLSLYLASELGTAGTIESIACRSTGATTAETYLNYQAIIGHSNVGSLSANAAANFISQNTVINGSVNVPAGLVAGDWIELVLTEPFEYDGKSNLVVWLGTTNISGAASTNFCAQSTPAIRYQSANINFTPVLVTVTASKVDIKLEISK